MLPSHNQSIDEAGGRVMTLPTTPTKGEQAKSQLIAAALAQFGD